MSNENNKKEIIRRISTVILNDIAPEEIVLADKLINNYLALDLREDVSRTEATQNDIPLGFGNIDLVVVILIPVILTALNKITESITNSTVDSVKEAITKRSKKKNIKMKFDTLTEMQIDKIGKQLTITLSSSKLTKKKAEKISDMILVLIASEL